MGINYTLDVIGSKWKPLILCYIGESPKRNGELLRSIPDISQKVLTQQLRELEEDHIIYRKSFAEVPPRVEYHLTSDGYTLKKLLVDLSIWGEERIARLQESDKSITLIHEKHDGYLE